LLLQLSNQTQPNTDQTQTLYLDTQSYEFMPDTSSGEGIKKESLIDYQGGWC